MKVIFINRGISFYRGGGENFDLNIALSLKNLGCEIEFITGKSLVGSIKYPVEDFKTIYLTSPYLRDLSQKIKKGSGYINLLDRKIFASKVLDYLKRINETVVLQVCSIPEIVEIKRYKNFPVVIFFPGPPWKGDYEKIKLFDKVITHGDTLNFIKENIRKDAIDIPPGVDTEVFKKMKSNIREKYKLEEKKVLIFTGRLVPIKNISFLIQSMKKLSSEYVLLIVGDGPMKNALKKEVEKEKLNEKIIFTGYIPQSQLPFYYSSADIFVFSSFYDNFPNSVLEAMACELPIIAPSVGGIPMIIENGINGYLYNPGNIEEFIEKVEFFIKNNNLREKTGKTNRKKIIKNYNWMESAKKLKTVYEKIL
ncbi:MAG TPA: glycosyltransferase family 4 protein [Candidatus Ratteibacteria bacterium]|nr:glycosyltransferase family 4 protein [Candidatus Ratteibacteria bacterium]